MTPAEVRPYILLGAASLAFIVSIIPPFNPVLFGVAGTMLGAEPLARAKAEPPPAPPPPVIDP